MTGVLLLIAASSPSARSLLESPPDDPRDVRARRARPEAPARLARHALAAWPSEVTDDIAHVAVATLSATGRPIAYVPVSPAEHRAAAVAAGVPADEADGFLELFTTVLDGRNASLTDGVRRALGRPARTSRTGPGPPRPPGSGPPLGRGPPPDPGGRHRGVAPRARTRARARHGPSSHLSGRVGEI